MSTYTPDYVQSQGQYNYFARLEVSLDQGRKTTLSVILPSVPYSNSVTLFQPRRTNSTNGYRGRVRGIVIEDQGGAMGEELIISIRHQDIQDQDNMLGLDIIVMANDGSPATAAPSAPGSFGAH